MRSVRKLGPLIRFVTTFHVVKYRENIVTDHDGHTSSTAEYGQKIWT
jgi:hypothetical protein